MNTLIRSLRVSGIARMKSVQGSLSDWGRLCCGMQHTLLHAILMEPLLRIRCACLTSTLMPLMLNLPGKSVLTPSLRAAGCRLSWTTEVQILVGSRH